jgi:hypothetical protein
MTRERTLAHYIERDLLNGGGQDGTLHIPIGIDPTLIDPKTWTNWTSPDSDVWPLTPTGASDSDSNIEVSDGSDISPYETAIRIVFHYLTFALGKAQATKTMNKMSVSPTFAVQSVVQAQNDDSCATVRARHPPPPQQTAPLTFQNISIFVSQRLPRLLRGSATYNYWTYFV